MEDYIYQIHKYLPIKFADEETNDFLRYLEETYIENIKNKKYQFAFKAFHMLYMTCIYKFSWFIKKINNESPEEKTYKIKTNINGQTQIQEDVILIQKLFEYSLISESAVIQKLLKKTGFHLNDIEKCKHHVDARNYCSHASGKIEYDEKGIDFLISDELKYIERLQSKTKSEQKRFLESFIEKNWDKSLIEADVYNFFVINNVSTKDLELLIDIEISLFRKKSDTEKSVFQKVLYLVFISEAQKYIESDKNIFLQKLPIFMVGLEKEIKIGINGSSKKVSMEEIMEEHLIPVISQFNEEDRKKAEKILRL